jgi:hypothetical protein
MGLTEKMLLLAFGLLVIMLIAIRFINKDEALRQLKEKYDTALQGLDKEQAYSAGKAYYSYLRGGEPTLQDERDMMTELAKMPEQADMI